MFTPKIKFFYTLLIFFIFTSCANIVTPTGGPKDETPPVILSSSPENFKTSFRHSEVVMQFDEYIQLTNPAQEVVISPAIEPPPKFVVKGKRLTIDLKEAVLDSNTTYTINFGDALKDVNESNPLSGFKYVFSTGDYLDSLTISGRVILAKEDKPAAKTLVLLHKNLEDTAFVKKKPFYFTLTDNDGSFLLENLRPGSYRLFALKDENQNYRYDLPNEEIAFHNEIIVLNDTASYAGITLAMFRESKPVPLQLSDSDASKTGYVRLFFSGSVENLKVISTVDSLPAEIIEANEKRDTFQVWFTRSLKEHQLRVIINDTVEKEITPRNLPEHIDSLKKQLPAFGFLSTENNVIEPSGPVLLTANRPLSSANFEAVYVLRDSPELRLVPDEIKLKSLREVEMSFKRQPGLAYKIVFPAGTFTDYLEQTSDSVDWAGTVKKPEDYGTISLRVNGLENQNYVMLLTMESKGESKPVFEKSFIGNFETKLEFLQPGSYSILIVYDVNANGKWDTGDFLNGIQPEKTYRHQERVNVRANWEMEAELNLKGESGKKKIMKD